jgi:lipopolysaccharide transport system permease protein
MAEYAGTSRRVAPTAIRQLQLVAEDIVRCRRILYTLTTLECKQKYAGSILGTLWYPLYSLLLLGSYCFIYLVVFHVRYREFGTYGFVLFVFSGLIPYLGFSESVTSNLHSVRSNLTILRNSVFPIELVPVKHVLAAFVPLLCSLAVLIAMIVPTEHAGSHFLYLPIPLLCLLFVSLTVAWIVSGVAVILPDLAQIVNIGLLLLMFISPIGYTVDMIPPSARPLVYLNPMTYLIEPFRYALLGVRNTPIWTDGVFLATSAVTACGAAALFKLLTPLFLDYE